MRLSALCTLIHNIHPNTVFEDTHTSLWLTSQSILQAQSPLKKQTNKKICNGKVHWGKILEDLEGRLIEIGIFSAGHGFLHENVKVS